MAVTIAFFDVVSNNLLLLRIFAKFNNLLLVVMTLFESLLRLVENVIGHGRLLVARKARYPVS